MAASIPQGRLLWEQGGRATSLDADTAEVLEFAQRVTRRLVAALGDLSPAEWAAPSRCSEWAVVDVANHLSDVLSRGTEMVAAAQEGRHAGLFDGFDPRTVPLQWVAAAPSREPAAVLERLRGVADQVVDGCELLKSVPAEAFRVETPLGSQPWPVGILHAAWDIWLHERDILLPLGRAVPEQADEVRLQLTYSLRMIGFIALAFGKTAGLTLDVRGGHDGGLRLDAGDDSFSVRRLDAGDLPEPVLRGDAATAADALCGRGDLLAALQGPAATLESVSVLRLILAGA